MEKGDSVQVGSQPADHLLLTWFHCLLCGPMKSCDELLYKSISVILIETLGSKGVTCVFRLYLTHLQRKLHACVALAIGPLCMSRSSMALTNPNTLP